MTRPAAARPVATQLRRPVLPHRTSMRLAATEYARTAEMIARIPVHAWRKSTDCPGWSVHDLVGHVVGMAEMAASIREGSRQRKAAMLRGGVFIDELTALQVREHAALDPAELVSRMRDVGPKAARGRRFTPAIIRRRAMPVPQTMPDGQVEWWSLGYLIDTILTRDPWMHRVDLSRAVDAPLQLSAGHDGVLVADVVAEWAARHARPYRLLLTGPAGGSWSHGPSDTRVSDIEMDAVEFCRAVSGRGPRFGLLQTDVPF